jgi:pyruvate/2-oxoglutarate dehydrogenase complex dihydrolipoamide acyltransferase (E2) component
MSDAFAVTVPLENVNDEFATIVEWNVTSGSKVKKGDVIVTLETLKATFELESEKEGFLFYEKEEGDEVGIGSAIAYICKENKKPAMERETAAADMSNEYDGNVTISAKAGKLMKEYGLRNEDFVGFEKVKIADVKARIADKGLKKRELQSGIRGKTQNIVSSKSIKISPAKRFEIRQLNQSNKRVVLSSVSIMVDMKKVEENIHNIFQNEKVQATAFELIISKTARLLKKYYLLNGFFDDGSCNIYDEINIGIAVNIGKGLRVPVVKNADTLTLKDISNTVRDLSLKYFREELGVGDLTGGTFTVTDLSSMGIVDFHPVINNMQSAILGVCSVMPGTNYFKIILTFDHNMADGMIAADMLNELSTFLKGN